MCYSWIVSLGAIVVSAWVTMDGALVPFSERGDPGRVPRDPRRID